MGQLEELYHGYRGQLGSDGAWSGLKGLYANYVKEREQTILDALASGVSLQSLVSAGEINFDAVTSQMREAFHLAYPNVDLSSLANRSPEELAGFISGWKGKLFEVEVRDHLNAGDWVGDLHLEPGQTAELATSATQPGWDLAISDSHGDLIDQIQLKATESLSYIKHAIEQYPDTHILATAELGHVSGNLHDMLSVSHISDEHLTDLVTEPLSDAVGHSLLDALLPGLPLALIAVTEGFAVMHGRRTTERASARAASRAGKSILAGAIGWGISALFGDVTGVVGGVVVRLAMGGESDPRPKTLVNVDYAKMERRLNNAIDTPRLLLPYYK
jgi:hypothetical protein